MLATLLLTGWSPASSSISSPRATASRSRAPSLMARARGARSTFTGRRCRKRAGRRLLLWRLLAERQQGDLPLRRPRRWRGAAMSTVVPDYRIYPAGPLSGFPRRRRASRALGEGQCRAVRRRSEKTFLMGHSAGAHIAAMLALDPRWLKEVGLVPGRDIAGLIGISGPYDFLPLHDETLKSIFGGANRPDTQPISHVAPGAPPALLMTGVEDDMVDPGNSSRLAARLRAAGDEATVRDLSAVGHLTIMGAFARRSVSSLRCCTTPKPSSPRRCKPPAARMRRRRHDRSRIPGDRRRRQRRPCRRS